MEAYFILQKKILFLTDRSSPIFHFHCGSYWFLCFNSSIPHAFSPLFRPQIYFLLCSLSSVGESVTAMLVLPFRRELLPQLLQLTFVHQPLLFKSAPLLFQVLFLQDLYHVLYWVWEKKLIIIIIIKRKCHFLNLYGNGNQDSPDSLQTLDVHCSKNPR